MVIKKALPLSISIPLAIFILSSCFAGCSNASRETTISNGSESIFFERASAMKASLMIMDAPGEIPRAVQDNVWGPLAKSSDGRKLAYISYPDMKFLKLLDLGTFRTEDINDMTPVEGSAPIENIEDMSWAPDSKRIYLYGTFKEEKELMATPGVWRLSLEDRSLKQMTLAMNSGPQLLHTNICVSPSGNKIILSGQTGPVTLCDVSRDSISNPKGIIPSTGRLEGPSTIPIWLNDREIAYVETYDSPRPERWSSRLMKMDVESGEKTTIMESDWEKNLVIGWVYRSFYHLACSPDGTRIIFPIISDVTTAHEAAIGVTPLFIINTDGTGLDQITDPEKEGVESGDLSPSWASR